MMGAGKSSIGRSLSEASGRDFLDTDAMLQQRLGRPISQIFQIYGEVAFRDHESNLLKSIEPGPSVVSTGGGIILREDNWEEFKRLGLTIFLDASIETLIERLSVSKKKRPLLQTENWEERTKEILDSRLHLYRQADIRVSVDEIDLSNGADLVLSAIMEYESHANSA